MTPTPITDASLRTVPPVLGFGAVICGVDGTSADAVAVRQAATIAGPTTTLELVSVVEGVVRDSAQFLLTPERARRALRQARDIAIDAGAHPEEHLVEAGWGENGALFERCGESDLLVVGSHARSRAEGILAGRTSTAAVHRAPCPVLVARPAEAFPGTVLLADDGGGRSDAAAEVATAIAARFGAEVLVAAPLRLDPAERRRLAEHTTALRETTGRGPVVVDVEGDPAHALPKLASRLGVSLLVLGSRQLHGVRALSSVSERVAHWAPCSVLVVRR